MFDILSLIPGILCSMLDGRYSIFDFDVRYSIFEAPTSWGLGDGLISTFGICAIRFAIRRCVLFLFPSHTPSPARPPSPAAPLPRRPSYFFFSARLLV